MKMFAEKHPAVHLPEDPYFVSLETVVAASPMLGHLLENRRPVREAHDLEMCDRLFERSAHPLSRGAQRQSFACAPVDILVRDRAGAPEFHLLELNGTGIGGASNLPTPIIGPVLRSLAEMATQVRDPNGVLLLGISGLESPDKPRLNKLMHEKMLFAEALKWGLRQRHGDATASSVRRAEASPDGLPEGVPVVMLGYMKEFLERLTLDDDGRLWVFGRRVNGILNDRFALNVLDHFGHRVDLRALSIINRTFLPGADKAVAYGLFNEYVQRDPVACLPSEVPFALTRSRNELVQTVLQWLRDGRQVVVKPHATGVGHGIEFFLDPHQSSSDVISTLDGSIRLTEAYYGSAGGAFPYTVCEFIDCNAIERHDHPLRGHKFELRVVVFRDDLTLRAFPSIAKIATRPFDPADRLSMINNVTAATEEGKPGVDFMLPLCRRDTLELLGLDEESLTALCRGMTRYVGHVLDRIDEEPARFGLPGPSRFEPVGG